VITGIGFLCHCFLINECGVFENAKDENQPWRGQAL
jgi:hypothetical protein